MSHAANQNADSLGVSAIRPAALPTDSALQPVRNLEFYAELAKLRVELADAPGRILQIASEADVERALAISREMFSGEPELEILYDPEDPVNPFVVITVQFDGSPRESVEQQLLWHSRQSYLPLEMTGAIRLSMVPPE